ncbi:hypothetical protein [Pedobacter antarcticus]|uniref:hypothetical protein n=1 Tax=Pedobacter antarcticus TaxID=34086 RepID=UPI00292CF9A9|nr:hypothetical protein [Pedobacter antarcticus]
MNFEIHIYLGSACISENSTRKYPLGERHAFLFYLREEEYSEYNVDKAEDRVAELGFDQIEFSRVGKLDSNRIYTEEKKEYYDNAIESGSTFIFYTDAVR